MSPRRLKLAVSENQFQKQLGNTMSVNVLERLLISVLPAAGLTRALPDRWAAGKALAELEASRGHTLARSEWGTARAIKAPLPCPRPLQLDGQPMAKQAEILEVLGRMQLSRGNVGSKRLGRRNITLGTTRRTPGAKNVDAHGLNETVVPNCLPPDEQACCQELWDLLRGEAKALGYEFTSAQINKNFSAQVRHNHRGKDTSYQWCVSLGDFDGGEFCWEEQGACFSVSTKDMWQRVDGRHDHWVLPYKVAEGSARYSLVLFRNKGTQEPLLYRGACE